MAIVLSCHYAHSSSPLPPTLASKEFVENPSSEELAPGVTFIKAHFSDLFGDGPVATYWLKIEWDKTKDISLNIARNPIRREKPTHLAKETRALATVNGTYHTTTDPSTPFYQLKVDGELIESKHKGGDGSLAFNHGEFPYIGKFSNDLLERYDNVISGDGVPGFGKPLPDYSDKSPEAKKKRASGRAPRTFAGNDTTNRITYIGVTDGRMKRSVGVNYVELRYLLEAFGCDPKALVSLDGGGSTMVAVRDGEKYAIRSVPSDNYPLSTERRVAEALQILDDKSLKKDKEH